MIWPNPTGVQRCCLGDVEGGIERCADGCRAAYRDMHRRRRQHEVDRVVDVHLDRRLEVAESRRQSAVIVASPDVNPGDVDLRAAGDLDGCRYRCHARIGRGERDRLRGGRRRG